MLAFCLLNRGLPIEVRRRGAQGERATPTPDFLVPPAGFEPAANCTDDVCLRVHFTGHSCSIAC